MREAILSLTQSIHRSIQLFQQMIYDVHFRYRGLLHIISLDKQTHLFEDCIKGIPVSNVHLMEGNGAVGQQLDAAQRLWESLFLVHVGVAHVVYLEINLRPLN